MKLSEFDFELPEELIAQHPVEKRDTSRLMVVNRENGNIEHRHFYDILDYLKPGDVLVRNNTKVIPARLFGIKEETNGHVEVLLLKELKKEMSNKKSANRDVCAAIACNEWFDVRAFGQVFAFKGIPVSFGVRGPVSIHQAVSLSPIDIVSMQITKSVNSESGKESKASDTMGMKHRVGFAVYKVMGSVNVQLAEKTGFSQEDAEELKEALKTLFENDASSARPEGSMEVRRIYWWQHDEKTPAISSGKIQRGFTIKERTSHPKEFEDYDISWNVEGCKEPEVF